MNKRFFVQFGIGKAKYVVNFHNGISKHKDGSDFYDIKIFKNKNKMNQFLNELRNNGYTE